MALLDKMGKTAPSAATRLGEFVAGMARGVVLEPVVLRETKRALLDCIASTLSGAREPSVERLINYQSGRLPGEAVVIGGGGIKLPLDAAALINGTMGHATDYDDVSFSMWGHATAPVFPAVLAIGESVNLSGADFLAAFLTGLEVEMKLGAAVAPHHYGIGWHPTATIGVFGACAGAAAAASLSAAQSAAALGIAASRSSGLRANFGSMTKALHVGFAARDGLEAALLASRDITSNAAALDGPFGFVDVMAGGTSTLPNMLAQLGKPFDIVTPGLALKYYPSCSDTHVAVDTLLELVAAEKISVESIRRVTCGVTKSVFENLIYHSPATGLQGKFSMEFCLARALEKGRLELEDFTDASVLSPATQRLMSMIEMIVDPSIKEGDYVSPALVEIQRTDGGIVRKIGRSARGHSDWPLDEAQLAQKFDTCAKVAFSAPAARRLYDIIMNIEEMPSIGPLAAALA